MVVVTCVNKIEAMYERTRANQKSRAKVNFYVYACHFIHWLYFIYSLKIYVCPHVKIPRQWKSTLNRKKLFRNCALALQTLLFKQPLLTKMHLHIDVSYFFYFALRGRRGNTRRLLGLRVFLRINKNPLCRNNWIMSFLTRRILYVLSLF